MATVLQTFGTHSNLEADVSPRVTDLCWKYILQNFSENDAVPKNFFFTIIAEDKIEQLTGELEELEKENPRSRIDILNDLWETAGKKELLNFIGADNKRELGLIVEYIGTASSCRMTIDRTNFSIKIYVNDVLDQTISYKNKTIKQISDTIDALADYTCSVHQDQTNSRTAHDLEPVKDLEIKGSAYLYVGSDIHCVIFNPQSPGQVKMLIDGRGSDRINISLRET